VGVAAAEWANLTAAFLVQPFDALGHGEPISCSPHHRQRRRCHCRCRYGGFAVVQRFLVMQLLTLLSGSGPRRMSGQSDSSVNTDTGAACEASSTGEFPVWSGSPRMLTLQRPIALRRMRHAVPAGERAGVSVVRRFAWNIDTLWPLACHRCSWEGIAAQESEGTSLGWERKLCWNGRQL
jgi:hypothetical protein